MKKAFTMIELIFVIVILGILASVAVPKLFVTRDDAIIAKARTDIAAVRTGINLARTNDILKGRNSFPSDLETISGSRTAGGNVCCFNAVIQGGVKAAPAGKNGWSRNGNAYTFVLGKKNGVFNYNSATGEFRCAGALCADLGE